LNREAEITETVLDADEDADKDADEFVNSVLKKNKPYLPDLRLYGKFDKTLHKPVFIPTTGAGDRIYILKKVAAAWKALGYTVILVVNKLDEYDIPIVPVGRVIFYTTSCGPSSGVARVVSFLLAWLWSKLCPDMQGAFGDDRRIVKLLGTADKLHAEVKYRLTAGGAVIVSPLSQRGATYEPQAYFAAQIFFFNSKTIEKIWSTIMEKIFAVSAPVGGDYALTSALQDQYGEDAVQIAVNAKRHTEPYVSVKGKKKQIRSLVRNDKILKNRLDASMRERISGVMVIMQLSSSKSSIARYIWKQIEGKNASFSIQRTLKRYLVNRYSAKNKLFSL
jgi:hypothetical protein